jgi:hypothetical protein
MAKPGWRLRILGPALLAFGLLPVCGCLGFLHPIDSNLLNQSGPCQALSHCCKDHVYIFLINGLDPMNYGNLSGLRDYLNQLGMSRTYYGQLYHVWYFAHEIRRIHQEDGNARFVLVGFSLGVNLADYLARLVEPDGVHIDLMVFLSGNHPVQPMPRGKPENVERVLSLLAGGIMGSRGERHWAENVRLSGSWHFESPTHPTTVSVLAMEMAMLSATVPITEPAAPPLPRSDEEAPTPRPVRTKRTARHGEWDFLKPVARLSHFPDDDRPARGNAAASPQTFPVSEPASQAASTDRK